MSDGEMRHGRKSKKKRIDGYKRHVAVQLDTPGHNGGRFTKADFTIDLESGRIRCPQGVTVDAHVGAVAHFPADQCVICPQRDLCTRAAPNRGRSISLHPQGPFLIELRLRARTPEGRVLLRRRIAVEHRLAAVHNRQGDRARYRGLRKNLFDLRRYAALNNLSVVDQLRRVA